MLLEIFTHDGVGTMVVEDTLDDLRPATIDDVGAILSLIEPLEADGTLVPRPRSVIERDVENFTVLEHDGVIYGCATLHNFAEEQMAEMACLIVHPEWQGSGEGEILLRHMESRPRGRRQAPVRADHAHLALVHQARLRAGRHRRPAARKAAQLQPLAQQPGLHQEVVIPGSAMRFPPGTPPRTGKAGSARPDRDNLAMRRASRMTVAGMN